MAKKLYAIGFDQFKIYANTNKKQLRDYISSPEKLQFFSIFGKSYYHIEILKFFNFHKITKDLAHSNGLLSYFTSEQFIMQTIQYSGINTLLTPDEKEYTINFFYCCVYHICQKEQNQKMSQILFHNNFFHFGFSYHLPSNIKVNHEQIAKNLLKPKTPKESFGVDENNIAFFKIILDSVTYINLKGASIKTLRKKGYKELLEKILEKKIL
jgi:hypothetical protein